METQIKRIDSCYRPLSAFYFLEISRIVFYSNENNQVKIKQGWLEDKSSLELNYSGNDVISILGLFVRKANKINFKNKDNFIIKFKDKENGYYSEGYALYIYIEILEPTILSEENEDSIHYSDCYRIPLKFEVLEYVKNKDPEEGYSKVPVTKNILTIQTNYRTELNSYGKEVESITNAFNKVLGSHYELSTYAVSKLLKKFEIKEIN